MGAFAIDRRNVHLFETPYQIKGTLQTLNSLTGKTRKIELLKSVQLVQKQLYYIVVL